MMQRTARRVQDDDVPLSARGPTVHGTYDFLLGGVQHLRADRELGEAIEERFPSVTAHLRAARLMHVRAGRWCAEQGIDRLVCTGVSSWKPGMRNVLDAAREVIPGAQAVYVHRDPSVHAWARAALNGTGARSVRGDVERPGKLLAAAPVAEMLAAGRPVAVMLGMTLHFAPAGEARAQVARYAAALPPGSALVLSVALPDDSARAAELLAMFTPARVYPHTAEDVAAWLENAGLKLAPPGVADVRLLPGCGWDEAEFTPRAPGMTAGALSVRP